MSMIGKLEKSFKILEILSKSIFPLKAAAISRKASMSRTTTFRLLFVLTQLGYIHKNNSSNTYTMGHKAFQFGETSDYLQSISAHCIGPGCYLVLPVLCPRTLRDAFGSTFSFIHDVYHSYPVSSISFIKHVIYDLSIIFIHHLPS